MKESSGKIYEFERFRVDAAEKVLLDGKNAIALTPKAFGALLLLIENGGHTVSKEKIMRVVWADSFIEKNNLAQNIPLLRKVLGEGKDGAKYIETVSKRGYRFIADVRKNNVTNEQRDEEKSSLFESNSAITDSDSPKDFPSPLLTQPETHYVQNGDVNIAYQVVGKGDFVSTFTAPTLVCNRLIVICD